MDGRFQTTHWSLVLAARDPESAESRVALEELCRAYWFPLYAFIRRQGYGSEEARDLTQGYFTLLLERRDLDAVRPELGRFRSFLLASIRHFLSNERDRDRAKKRAPELPLVSLDTGEAERRYALEPAETLTPEILFEQKWAAAVVARTLDRLQAEWADDDRAPRFRALRGHLAGDGAAAPYGQVAESLGITEDAVKVTVHRLRRRFGELLRGEIAETVRDPGDVDDEIRHLLTVLN